MIRARLAAAGGTDIEPAASDTASPPPPTSPLAAVADTDIRH